MDKEILSRLDIIYIEDDIQIQANIKNFISKLFNNFDVAENGEEGLDKYNKFFKLNNKYYDIVITDIEMPKLNGLDMSKQILSINPKQHIIVTSAYNESNKLQKMINIGIKSFIHKPIDMKDLLEEIKKNANEIDDENSVSKNIQETKEKNQELQNLNHILEDKIKERTKELEYMLYYDSLTGLKSEFSLKEDIKKAEFSALFFIDIDRLTIVNTLYGYEHGDDLIKQFATCLNKLNEDHFDNRYNIYRIGADKFAMYEANNYKYIFNYEDDLIILKDTIRKYDFIIDGIEFNISATIGLSFGQEKPIETADTALAYAKDNKIPCIAFTTEIDNKPFLEQNLQIRKKIKSAIENRHVYPVFQPIVNRDKEIIKYEILMRIIEREEDKTNMLYPADFLDIAVDSKQYNQLFKILLEKTFEIMDKKDKDFSINLSYADIYNKEIVSYIKENLKLYPHLGEKLIIEILETLEIKDPNIMQEFVEEMEPYGVRLAIDDFGTGYSNFVNVLDLNAQYVKIDGKFIKNLDTSKKSQVIVKSIISFARELNIKVIAEYIHNEIIFNIAKDYGIDEFQGYYISKPLEQI